MDASLGATVRTRTLLSSASRARRRSSNSASVSPACARWGYRGQYRGETLIRRRGRSQRRHRTGSGEVGAGAGACGRGHSSFPSQPRAGAHPALARPGNGVASGKRAATRSRICWSSSSRRAQQGTMCQLESAMPPSRAGTVPVGGEMAARCEAAAAKAEPAACGAGRVADLKRCDSGQGSDPHGRGMAGDPRWQVDRPVCPAWTARSVSMTPSLSSMATKTLSRLRRTTQRGVSSLSSASKAARVDGRGQLGAHGLGMGGNLGSRFLMAARSSSTVDHAASRPARVPRSPSRRRVTRSRGGDKRARHLSEHAG